MERKPKKSIGGAIVIGILAVVVGLCISVQISSNQSDTVGGLIPSVQVNDLETQLKNLRMEKEAAVQALLDTEARLAEIEADRISDDAFLQTLSSELEKYKMSAGVVDVKGPGIVITIDDPIPTEENPGDGYSTIMVHSDLMLSLVNKLKEAGAEAISINGNRIVANTEISLAGSNVNINGNPTAPPYIISAIGDPETMESAITIRYGIVELMRGTYALQVNIAKQEEITITRYSGIITFRYATPYAPVEAPVTEEDPSAEGEGGTGEGEE
ncbi:MAG: DUF881 domain-containing protein [Firmicutes bacterium]|nr:DUF881 domain-containing protein [Clostridiales bacterium]MBQ9931400.1 DUF881 domain-containing protein [Bacillota bacterium]